MNIFRKIFRYALKKYVPESQFLFKSEELTLLQSYVDNSIIGNFVKLNKKYHVESSKIDDFTYVANNSHISNTTIGKFCSLGPNLVCGWGIHPTIGISTAPMFYSTLKQNGTTLTSIDKIQEQKTITIGNDVFIGANVTILDGITIGDGAVIGAGAVVSKDIPPYAIAVGCPIQIIKYRFEPAQIDKLLKIKWWEFDEDKLKDVERMFFDVDMFMDKYYSK